VAAPVAVEIVLVGVGIDAQAAPDDANLRAALDQMTAEWATAFVEPTFTFVDFDGDLDRFAVVDIDTAAGDYRELNDLLRTADPVDADTLTFFLVPELRDSGSTILGLAAGPPGAAGLPRTSKSGVVVTAADLAAAPTDVGKIMAHEGGHFLGLYHTTERDGRLYDPLGDTPECPASANTGGGSFSVDECASFDGTNVMFWTLTDGSASLTSDQSYVLRHNPIVR